MNDNLLGERISQGGFVAAKHKLIVAVLAWLLTSCEPSSGESHKVTYRIQAPDGNIYQVEGPKNATQKQVVHAVLQAHPEAAIPQGGGAAFYGYNCTDDCSGHEAGYQWAEQQGITDPDECGGNSASFEEGCQAYAEAYAEEQRGFENADGY